MNKVLKCCASQKRKTFLNASKECHFSESIPLRRGSYNLQYFSPTEFEDYCVTCDIVEI
jgi:hypothetical protein